MIEVPCVIDADALYFLSKHPSLKLPSDCILTPHHEEMKRILQGEDPSQEACQRYVEDKKVTLVLKGAPTFIFQPGQIPLIIPRGDPGMATAGTGDVLTGILGGLLAQKVPCFEAAQLGVYLHAVAGESAAMEMTSYCMIASDLIAHLPNAFLEIMMT